MGTDERCMAWIKDEIGRAVGLPPEIGGIPLDEIGATGLGLRASVEASIKYCDFDLKGARVVVQGFGSVGKHAARFLGEKGAVLIAACDSRETIFNPKGIDVERLIALKNSGKNVRDYADAQRLDTDAIIDIECEIWIPAARPDVVRKDNVARLKTKLVAQGANIPFTPGREKNSPRPGHAYSARLHRQRRRCGRRRVRHGRPPFPFPPRPRRHLRHHLHQAPC